MDGSQQLNPFEAGHFELHGDGLEVIYDQVPGQPGLRHMTVSGGPNQPKHYLGGEIALETTTLGTIATVGQTSRMTATRTR